MVAIKTFKKKICLLGDPAVGKTSLIKRFVYDEFDDKYISTLGAKVSKKDLQINILRKSNEPINVNMNLSIWDILGQIQALFKSLLKLSLFGFLPKLKAIRILYEPFIRQQQIYLI